MDYSKITLGELLSSPDDIIRRNAVSILKRYQKIEKEKCELCDWGDYKTCIRCKKPNSVT